MDLVDDWKTVLRKSWAIRLSILASLLAGAEAFLPLVTPAQPSGMFALTAFVVSALATYFRLVKQPSMHDDAQTSDQSA